MSNHPAKTFDDLVDLIIPIISVSILLQTVRDSPSPRQATLAAEKAGYGEELVEATRWAAIIKRDHAGRLEEAIQLALAKAALQAAGQ